jgi:GDPmannose 4,6-dehydratase
LNAKRDWGHAKDYVDGMWRVLQQPKAQDFVLATGVTTSIRDFCILVFGELGIELQWKGKDQDEVGINKKNGKTIIKIDPVYFRPTEVDLLLGDSSKAREQLSWKPTFDLNALVKEMVKEDLELAKRDQLLKDSGYKITSPEE